MTREEELESQNLQLRIALQRYGQHSRNCTKQSAYNVECKCGLGEALEVPHVTVPVQSYVQGLLVRALQQAATVMEVAFPSELREARAEALRVLRLVRTTDAARAALEAWESLGVECFETGEPSPREGCQCNTCETRREGRRALEELSP